MAIRILEVWLVWREKGQESLVLGPLVREPSHTHTHLGRGIIALGLFSLPKSASFLWMLVSHWTYERFGPEQFVSHT